MIQTPVFAANWKMHHGPRAARTFIERFLTAYPQRDDRTVVICPSAVSIETVARLIEGRPDLAAGVQNVWTEPKGAFTGENSAPMALEAGARYALVGHSERRHVFGETNAQTAAKCAVVVEQTLIPILCVGETLAQRESGTAENVVIEQLRMGTSRLSPQNVRRMLVAYEPVWAIGTGKTATPADATAMHVTIRSVLGDVAGAEAARVPILYGGSVSATNAGSLLAADEIDGLLVGGASLDPEVWASICQT